jgi:hypothetical protein
MPRIYKRKVDWDDPVARRAYVAGYARKQRALGLKATNNRLPRRIVVKQKRDIFEVAAQLERALRAANERAVPRFGYNNDQTLEALAAYKEYWEQD